MQIGPTAAERISALVQGLLDRGYTRSVQPVLRAIATSAAMEQRLRDLEVEAARRAAAGERLAVDNAVLQTTLETARRDANRAARIIDNAADGVQASAITAGRDITRELAIGGIDQAALVRIGVRWNMPDPEAVARLIDYTNSSGWAAEIRRYPDLVVDVVRNQAIRGVVEGWNPVRTAREIRRMSTTLPTAQANTLMRTLQLTSYRDAAAINQRANADILTGQIRLGTLDGRICMACIALHGTTLPAGERVDDHHNGRCVGVPVVRGMTRQVVTGEEWFNGLSEQQQQAIAGPGAYELLRSGRAQLRDFAVEYQDQTFGRMVREATLREIEGR